MLIFNYKGLIKSSVLIKLSKFDQNTPEFLNNLSELAKLKETLGDYDISLLVVSNEDKFENILFKINQKLHNNLINIDIIKHSMEDTLGYKSFCGDFTLFREYKLLEPNMKYELNKYELKIIKTLKDKPNISYNELSKKTGMSYLRLRKIITNLEDNNLIRFSIDPNYEKLNLEFHNILLRINISHSKQFEKNMINNPNVHWIKKGIGKWDYILSIATRNIKEFIDVTQQIRTQNKDIIFDFSTLVSKINIMRKY